MHRLWSYQDYVGHLSHSSSLVRNWAFEAISEQYPRRFSPEVAVLIGDPDKHLACQAPKYLAEHGADEFAPAILESFLNDDHMIASNCAGALGKLKYEPAFDVVVERLRNVEDIEIFLGIIHYLGCIHRNDSHEVLTSVFSQSQDSDYVGSMVGSLLAHRKPTDVPMVMDTLFVKDDKFRTDMFLRNIMSSVSAGGLYRNLTEYGRENILEDPKKAIEKLLQHNQALKITPELKEEIISKLDRRQYHDLATSLLFDAQQTVRSRFPEEDKVPDFLQETFNSDKLSVAVLEWFAKKHSKWGVAQKEEDFFRNLVSTVLATHLCINERNTYITALESNAPLDELMNATKNADEDFPKRIIERLVELSPINELKNALTKELLDWGDIWIVRTMGKIGDKAFVPDLIRVLRDTDPLAYIYSDAITALHGIEEAGHEHIFSAIHKKELTSASTITALLEHLPYSESFDIEYSLWNDDKADDIDSYEFYGYCLRGIGDARGIETLQDIFYEGNSVFIGDPLETLALLYNKDIPELPMIRESRKAESERRERRKKELNDLAKKAAEKRKTAQKETNRRAPVTTFKRKAAKVGRNDPCPCGSGKKFKKCCLNKAP
jgi:HEAT repeat protein